MLEPDIIANNDNSNSDNPPLLSLKQVDVGRGEFMLCQGVNLTLNAGDICHLIGANGTGKTTLLMQLVGMLPTINGQIHWHDTPPPLFVSHELGIHPNLTVAQNLNFLLNLYGIDAKTDPKTHAQALNANLLSDALAWVGLLGYDNFLCQQLSAGQSRRVNLARLAVMTPRHTPVWLLDEPLTALDVAMVAKLEQRLQTFSEQGGAVLMTSHQALSVANKQLDLSEYLP